MCQNDGVNRFIEKLKRLAPLDEQDVHALTGALSPQQSFPRSRDIIREGDRPGPVIVVLEGWACRYKILPGGARQITAFMMPGDACDLHAGLLAEMDHSIQSLTAATVATISRRAMEAVMDAHPRRARHVHLTTDR